MHTLGFHIVFREMKMELEDSLSLLVLGLHVGCRGASPRAGDLEREERVGLRPLHPTSRESCFTVPAFTVGFCKMFYFGERILLIKQRTENPCATV